MSLRVEELKREILFSVANGAIKLKSNCPHCYETGIEGYVEGKPLLCRCMRVDDVLLERQNRGELEHRPS